MGGLRVCCVMSDDNDSTFVRPAGSEPSGVVPFDDGESTRIVSISGPLTAAPAAPRDLANPPTHPLTPKTGTPRSGASSRIGSETLPGGSSAGSAAVQQVGRFFVCPEHATVEPLYVDGPAARPLRIFLSYGHDGNAELVGRIKADLEKRKHDVWFDKTEIKFGDDWRRSITEGIASSHKVVSFLSKHSTRDPGVCLDEIGIAIGVKEGNILTILVESEQDVKPPPGVGHRA